MANDILRDSILALIMFNLFISHLDKVLQKLIINLSKPLKEQYQDSGWFWALKRMGKGQQQGFQKDKYKYHIWVGLIKSMSIKWRRPMRDNSTCEKDLGVLVKHEVQPIPKARHEKYQIPGTQISFSHSLLKHLLMLNSWIFQNRKFFSFVFLEKKIGSN